jgi:predicted SnoaL-like aldol condensation-catalyzing enzyme
MTANNHPTLLVTGAAGHRAHTQHRRNTIRAALLGLGLALILLLSGPGAAAAQGSTASFLQAGQQRQKKETRNKSAVRFMYSVIFDQGKTELVSKFFAENYIQHDPTQPNGRQGVIDFVHAKLAQQPRPWFMIKHILADGDFVAVHVQVTPTPSDEFSGQAVLDLYRLDHGLIVEHWVSIQDVPPTSASGNSMFSTLYPNPPARVSEQQEAANRELVRSLADRLFNHGDLSVVDQYWAGPNYIQHNPMIPNGADALKGFLSLDPPSLSQMNTKYAVADGNYVLLFQHMVFPSADPNNEFAGFTVADLYHVVNQKVVEHWDVGQPVPATSVSGNSMFSSLYQH